MADGENPRARQRRDWTADLPTSVLARILSLLPLPTAILCGYVSNPWRAAQRELLASVAELDLGRKFAHRLPADRYLTLAEWILALRRDETLGILKLFFKLGSPDQLASLTALLDSASSKRTRMFELELLVVPEVHFLDQELRMNHGLRCLFHPWAFAGTPHPWRSLTCLAFTWDGPVVRPLIYESLRLPLLQTLSLRGFNITAVLTDLSAGCPLLSTVKLIECSWISKVKISSLHHLCSLEITDCFGAIEIDAPSLRSFHVHGHLVRIELKDVTGLVDVYLCTTGWQEFVHEDVKDPSGEDWSFLSDIVHVTTLTMCDLYFENLFEFAEYWLEDRTSSLTFKNLQKLHIIIEEDSSFDLTMVEDLLRICCLPVLENLFIQLAMKTSDGYIEGQSEPTIPIVMLNALRSVSVKGFRGFNDQLDMIEFFLRSAVALETLVVCISPHYEEDLFTVQMKLEAFPKASETVKILIFVDDDNLSLYTASSSHDGSDFPAAELVLDNTYNGVKDLMSPPQLHLKKEEEELATCIESFVAAVDTTSAWHTVLLDQDMPTLTLHHVLSPYFTRAALLSHIYNGDEDTCVRMLRMRKATFHALVDELKVRKLLQDTREVSVKEQVALFLCIVGHRSVGRGTWKSALQAVHKYFESVLEAILCIGRSLIRYRSFQTHPHILGNPRYAGFFNDCIGALDGTHFHVLVSPEDANTWRRESHSETTQNVLAVVDFSGRFTYVMAGWEGSARDARVLASALRHQSLVIPQGKYLLGDSAYQLRPGFLTPYRNSVDELAQWNHKQPLNAPEMYNFHHSSLQITVVRAFDELRRKFRILESPAFHPIKTQVEIVWACCALHNWIIEHECADGLPKPDPQLDAMLSNPILYPHDRAQDGPWRQFRNQIAQANWSAYLAGVFEVPGVVEPLS